MNRFRIFTVDFLRIYVFLLFTYLGMKLVFNLIMYGWVDVRRAALMELAIVPLGQAVAMWFVLRLRDRNAVQAK